MLTTMKSILSAHLATELQMTSQEILQALESPKDAALGDLAFPTFALAKKMRKGPPQIAKELSEKLKGNLPQGFEKVEPVAGYVNFFFDKKFWSETVLTEIQRSKENVGNQTEVGGGRVAVFDYSSPNVAKPMSIGHLRSTVIGQSLVNVFKTMGYRTVGINYLGDWGVQFGKLAWAHLNKNELILKAEKLTGEVLKSGFNTELWHRLIKDVKSKPEDSFDYLYAIYVVFHALEEIDKSLESAGRDYFRRLEQRELNAGGGGSAADVKLVNQIEEAWKKFVDVSLTEYNRIYALLGTRHDLVRGESYYEPALSGVVKELTDKKLLKESEGAQIVDLAPFDMPPCLITKSDGATLYATRDIAAAHDRHHNLKADRIVYVVGAEQSLHFKQLFKVLELMGHSWSKGCEHVPFGLYRFKEGKMSTRRGNVVFLEDVLDRAIDLVKEIIKAKNPDLKNPDRVAEEVGTGAVIFNDLMNDRVKNIDFDWDRLLDFNGDTGPYVQYTHVRCCSILAKWNRPLPGNADLSLLKEKLEMDVLRVLGRLPDALRLAYEQMKPNWIAHYLLDLSKAFNGFYYEHRILEGDEALQKARIVLVDSTRIVLKKGLELLGIRAPEAM